MNKIKLLKGAGLVALTAMLPLSQASADVNISGWVNEGVQFYDDGVGSDAGQITDHGTTLGSRITFSGSEEVAAGIDAGFEIILEPQSNNNPLIPSGAGGFGGAAGSITQANFGDTNGHTIGVLGSSLNVGGAFGKVTVGLQSMPTDNIAVLEDPSLTLWSGISPIFRNVGFTIRGLGTTAGSAAATKTTWGSFLQCLGTPGLGIGIDCNGVYRNGVRYDLPAFGPVTVAIGWANDDIYDIAAKWKGQIGGMNASVATGFSINQGGAGAGQTSAETFQMQAGLMDPSSGIFGSIAYQAEDASGGAAATALAPNGDDTDAFWLKVGVKRAFNSLGDTSISFDYGTYNDQWGTAADGITGSEVERMGIAVNQYFGSKLIIYGKWENLDLNIDGSAAALATYNTSEELDMFTLGGVFFF